MYVLLSVLSAPPVRLALFLVCLRVNRRTIWLSSSRCCTKLFFTLRKRCISFVLLPHCLLVSTNLHSQSTLLAVSCTTVCNTPSSARTCWHVSHTTQLLTINSPFLPLPSPLPLPHLPPTTGVGSSSEGRNSFHCLSR